MSDLCDSCRQSLIKSRNQCGACQRALCKDCTQFLDSDAFSFLKKVPEEISHSAYCSPCYDQKVAPALESYEAVMERAREITVFYKNERNLPGHRAINKMVKVEACDDRKETLLRLAFSAAEQSFNALVNVELTPKKVKIDGYQKTVWSGSGFPARVFGMREINE